jgi:hypothetical protein
MLAGLRLNAALDDGREMTRTWSRPAATTMEHHTKLVEIRSYRLRPGTWTKFERLFRDEALPLLAASGIDVVGFGRSPDDPNAAFLIRAFADLIEREAQEADFYGGEAWRTGPREAILACIETYIDTVLTLDVATIDGLRIAAPIVD